MKKRIKVVALFLITVLLCTQVSFAEDKAGPIKKRWREFLGGFKKPSQEEKSRKPRKSHLDRLTKKELLKRIKDMLETWPELKGFIPGLENMDLEKLDKEALMKIYKRINIERIRLRTERIERQIKAAKISEGVPEPPQIYTLPAEFKMPQPAPSPPKLPTPPPSPPQPRRR